MQSSADTPVRGWEVLVGGGGVGAGRGGGARQRKGAENKKKSIMESGDRTCPGMARCRYLPLEKDSAEPGKEHSSYARRGRELLRGNESTRKDDCA